MKKTGVLLVNLGTPDAPTRGAVYRYLRQFLADPRVIDQWFVREIIIRFIVVPIRAGQSAKGYQQLWTENGSPLKYYGEVLAKNVQEMLGEKYVVELAMRYQNPSIESALNSLVARQVEDVVVLPLFPHYASASTGSVHEEVMRLMAKLPVTLPVKMLSSFHDLEPMIDVFANNARKFDIDSYDHILFSYHGLPQRHMRKADSCNHCLQSADCCQTLSTKNRYCYSAQCHDTTRLLVEKLGLKEGQYTTCFQSRLGVDDWVKPYTFELIEELGKKGMKRLLAFSPAFVSDCLETTVEISDEYLELFEEHGGEVLDLVPSLNDDPKWMKAVADMVAKA